jgi:hypothetical protein
MQGIDARFMRPDPDPDSLLMLEVLWYFPMRERCTRCHRGLIDGVVCYLCNGAGWITRRATPFLPMGFRR